MMDSFVEKDVNLKVEKFFSQYSLRKYSKGQILLLSGDEAKYIYYLVSGSVKQYDVSYRGEEVILNVYKPSAFFPMSMVINTTLCPYIFEADTDITLRQAPATEVLDFILANKDVMYNLLSRVYIGVDGLMSRMIQLMTGSAKSRLVFELITEAKRFGKVEKNGILLDINEKDLGSRAGLSRETVSREVKKLKDEKIIAFRNKGILINNISALQLVLNSNN